MILETLSVLVGLWSYEAYQYRGTIKAPTSTEKLVYEFHADGRDRLYWDLLDAGNFCERTGRYEFKEGHLIDTVEAVNPENHESCASDPDMVVGNRSVTPARIENSKLILTLGLGEEKLELIFVKDEK